MEGESSEEEGGCWLEAVDLEEGVGEEGPGSEGADSAPDSGSPVLERFNEAMLDDEGELTGERGGKEERRHLQLGERWETHGGRGPSLDGRIGSRWLLYRPCCATI